MEISQPYLLFLGDVHDHLAAKTAQGIVDWRREWCEGQLRLEGCKADCGLPDMGVADARAAGVKTMVVGVVNPGGVLPDHWIATIVEAIEAGMDIATGLHQRLRDVPEIAEAADNAGVKLIDVRHSTQRFATGKGTKRPGKRLLTVGTDCSVGKKYTSLALEKGMRDAGMNADFRATGQTGVFISGRGVSIDAVVADFIAGAAEWLSPANDPDHWDVVEGQGSLFHPSFAGVSLGLLHGAQPDAFVVCHEPTRTKMRNVETPIADIGDVIDMTIAHGRLTNPDITCVGLAINTKALDDDAAKAIISDLGEKYGLPACDPIRTGVAPIVERIKQLG
ncbi:N-acetyltransferase DgcN [Tepidamorphus sp. 3E244]|uniref:N-acetyltransferase DgcN n=1 Tax=Tepidamorphus sp. 3E244 TaxID=3385498 RepID=UPI0038FC79BF